MKWESEADDVNTWKKWRRTTVTKILRPLSLAIPGMDIVEFFNCIGPSGVEYRHRRLLVKAVHMRLA
jgi:hypothetical protein